MEQQQGNLPPLTEKQHREIELREQDRWLPIANVGRLMKNTLPATAKVSKDAKECMQECVSEFISFITSESSDKCLSEKRKTINGEDILFAMSSLGFENYSEVLKIYLAKYREQQSLKQERKEPKKPKNKPEASLYDQQQELEREMTNIPFHDEQEMHMNNNIPEDLMRGMNDESLLNLDGEHQHHEQSDQHSNGGGAQESHRGHDYSDVELKSENVETNGNDGVLYELSQY